MTSSAIGRLGQLDAPTLMKVQAGCNYINAEIQKRRRQVVRVAIVVTALGLFSYAMLWRLGVRDPRLPMAAVVLAAGGYATGVRRNLVKDYKRIVVRRIVSALGQGLTYSPESRFTKQNFLDMDLFEKRAEQWHAEDEVSGRKNAVAYSILEARATRTEGSGKSRRTVVIFQGLIVRLDFNKHFASHTVVVSNAESQILGGLLGERQGRRGKELVSLENADFENQFSVYATDQQQARYLLTPKLMELILEAQALLGSQLRLSFHDNSVFVTVPQKKNRFEIRLFGGPVAPETVAGELAELIKLADRLVDTLDLETRIWSRA